jgi:hypothetical protein
LQHSIRFDVIPKSARLLNENDLLLQPFIDKPVQRNEYFNDESGGSDDARDDYRLIERGTAELCEGLNLRLCRQAQGESGERYDRANPRRGAKEL